LSVILYYAVKKNIPNAESNRTDQSNRNNSMENTMTTTQNDVPIDVSIDTTMTASSLSGPSQVVVGMEEAIVGTENYAIENENEDKSITMASYTSKQILAGNMANVREKGC